MSQEMDPILANQQDLYGKIARTSENLKKAGPSKLMIGSIEARLKQLDQNWAKFDKIHDHLRTEYWEHLAKTNYIKNDEYSLAEVAYYEQRAVVLEHLRLARIKEGVKPANTSSSTESSRKKLLPRINLPVFGGRFEEWPAFRDLFLSIIDADEELPGVEKLHYLKSVLKGDAELMIRNVPVTAENYEHAWNMLQGHFENKRLLVRSTYAAFDALSRMKSETSAEMRRVFNGMLQAKGALEGIGRLVDNNDFFIHHVIELFDNHTRKEWKIDIGNSSDPPTLDEVKAFMERRLRALEALRSPPSISEQTPLRSTPRTPRAYIAKASPFISGGKPKKCSLCSGQHYILGCPDFQRKGPIARKEFALGRHLCLNCFGSHTLSECPSGRTCATCQQRHHSTIHEACVPLTAASYRPVGTTSASAAAPGTAERKPQGAPTTQPAAAQAALPAPAVVGPQQAATALHVRSVIKERKYVLLATARLYVKDKMGNKHVIRALLDSGSEVSLASESLMQKLRLPRESDATEIFGIGGTATGRARGRVTLNLEASTSSPYNFQISALILPRIATCGAKFENYIHFWPHLTGIELADPEYYLNNAIELILGADVYASVIESGVKKGENNAPVAIKTALGWILFGTAGGIPPLSNVTVHHCKVSSELEMIVRQFWQQEELPSAPLALTNDELRCEKLFVDSHRRNLFGRYIVRLPFKETSASFHESRKLVLRPVTPHLLFPTHG
ncbi:uncharacterized protein [Cardiocondyla obscurior]|uniref:uncharacterized protein n=1 Tax=Cardiocondyla obscurior TaxID=286306 RepID=UPI0039656030